jgi:RHS repeat-associated protein
MTKIQLGSSMRRLLITAITMTLAFALAASPPLAAEAFFAVPPCKVFDTTPGGGQPSLGPGAAPVVALANTCGVPPTATAASLNVTVTQGTQTGGFLAFHASDRAWTGTSNINWHANQTISNSAIVQVSTDGRAAFTIVASTANGSVNAVIYVNGYFSNDDTGTVTATGPLGYQNVDACRILDSRQPPLTSVAGGGTSAVQVQGACGIPPGTPAVALNLTGILYGLGSLSLYPTDGAQSHAPDLSIDNFYPVRASGVVSPINGAEGPDLGIASSAPPAESTQYILDTAGYFDYGAPYVFVPIPGCRALDTRVTRNPLLGSQVQDIDLVTPCNLPAGTIAAAINVTSITPTQAGTLVLFPAGAAVPPTSFTNFPAGDVLANGAIANLGTGSPGAIALLLSGTTANSLHVVVDVFGYFAPSRSIQKQSVTPFGLNSNLNVGFKAAEAFAKSALDTINPLNGNLNLRLPLGRKYVVSDTLSYGLELYYNSKIFAFDQHASFSPDGPAYLPQGLLNPLWNAGSGWLLTLGELRAPQAATPSSPGATLGNVDSDNPGHWLYISPDGAEHAFYNVLNTYTAGTLAPPSSDPLYSRDGSYLRLSGVSNGNATSVELDFPDGRYETFVPSDGSRSRWVLASIHDRFSGYVNVFYSPTSPNLEHPSVVSLVDSLGRTQQIYYYPISPTGVPMENSYGRPLVEKIVLTDFSNTNAKPATQKTATYAFHYTLHQIHYPCGNLYFAPGSTAATPISSWELDSITLPDNSTYRFGYDKDEEARPQDANSCATSSGMLTNMTLPTGGGVIWSYQQWLLPAGDCSISSEHVVSAGVSCRETFNTGGLKDACTSEPPSSKWTFAQQLILPPPSGVCTGTLPFIPMQQEEITTITDPQGDETVHYFSVLPQQTTVTAGLTNQPTDEGLPFTRRVADATGTRFLSTEICSGACQWTGNPTTNSPPYLVTNALRSTYLAFDRDGALAPSQILVPDFQHPQDLQQRLASESVVFHDDGGNHADSTHVDFDGLGHYRTTIESGSFFPGGAPRDWTRSSFRNFNAAGGVYIYNPVLQNPVSGNTFHPPPASSPWVLNTFAQELQQEGPNPDGSGGTYHRVFTCFDARTGLLRQARTLNNAQSGQYDTTDLLVVNTADANGNLAALSYYGGDGSNLDTAPADSCGGALPASPSYSLALTHQNGVTASAQFQNLTPSHTEFNFAIDWSTGLPMSSTDKSGLTTALQFDFMGRVTAVQPGGSNAACGNTSYDAWTTYLYHPSQTAACTDTNPENAACTQVIEYPSGCTNQISEHRFEYDGEGRILREHRTLPSSKWGGRLFAYNTMGWLTAASEWSDNFNTPGNFTRYQNFDAFGRPRKVTAPDQTTTTLFYGGVRSIEADSLVATGFDTSGAPQQNVASTVRYWDRMGRLVSVQESQPLPGNPLPNSTTYYDYSVLDRLTGVNMTTKQLDPSGNGYSAQKRTFSYDDRGFLKFEDMPEKVVAPNQHGIVFSNYDALGNYRTKTDGSNTLHYSFDAGGRLLSIYDNPVAGGVQMLKQFTYDTPGYGASLGKVVTSSRFHYLVVGGTNYASEIRETMTYMARGGRPSHRELSEALNGGAPIEVFDQDFSYGPSGKPDLIDYPSCSFSPCQNTDPKRTVALSYDQDLLTVIGNYATVSYYPSHLANKVQYINQTDWWQQGLDPHEMPRPASISGLGTPVLQYAYDGSGNVTSFGSETYSYDLLSRLTAATLGNGSFQTYTYDPFGNLQALGGTSARNTPTAPTTNQLVGATFDSAGNMLAAPSAPSTPGASYSLDQFNLMTQFVSGTPGTSGYQNWYYFYDASDQRVWSYSSENAFHPRLDRWTIRDRAGKVLRRYETAYSGLTVSNPFAFAEDYIYRGSKLLAGETPSGQRHFLIDNLGTPRVIRDGNGSNLAAHAYFPYGEEAVASTDLETAKFAGYERDLHNTSSPADDLDYLLARFLSPVTARFLSVDQLGVDPAYPQSWNGYAYVRGNPLRLVDPSGHDGSAPNDSSSEPEFADLDDSISGWLLANDPVFAGSAFGEVTLGDWLGSDATPPTDDYATYIAPTPADVSEDRGMVGALAKEISDIAFNVREFLDSISSASGARPTLTSHPLSNLFPPDAGVRSPYSEWESMSIESWQAACEHYELCPESPQAERESHHDNPDKETEEIEEMVKAPGTPPQPVWTPPPGA